jgi:hypothetical protein
MFFALQLFHSFLALGYFTFLLLLDGTKRHSTEQHFARVSQTSITHCNILRHQNFCWVKALKTSNRYAGIYMFSLLYKWFIISLAL